MNKALYFLSILTLLGNLAIIIAFVVGIIAQFQKKLKTILEKFLGWVAKQAMLFSFIMVLFASLGSLYSSEIALLEPCKLCWLQRTMMFPQAIILGIALKKKLNQVFYFTLPLSIIGAAMAGYQYYLQMTFDPAAPCVVGGLVSCSEKYIFNFGYITIPWMSLTAFLFISILSAISIKRFRS